MFIAFLALFLGILLVGPYGIREQLHAWGLRLDTALEDSLPWAIKRLKSAIVGKLILPSVVMAGSEVTWVWALFKEMPDLLDRTRLAGWTHVILDRVDDPNLKDAVQTLLAIVTLRITDTWLRLMAASVFFLVVFATWNYLQGHLRRTGTGEDDWELPYGLWTGFSLPHWWAVLTPTVWLIQGLYITFMGIMAHDRMILTLGLLSLAMFWTMGKLGIEVLAALVFKGTGLGEWALTTAAKMPGMPQVVKDSIPKGGVNVLEEEKIAAALREYWNMLAIMWLPFINAVFILPRPIVATAFFITTVLASVASLMLISQGEAEKVKKATKDTTEWIWKWGKLVTPLVFGLAVLFQWSETARMWWDEYGNIMAGISPVVTFSQKPGYYLVVIVTCGLIVWVVRKASGKATGFWEKLSKVVMVGLSLGVIYCMVAVAALICKHPTFGFDRRIPAEAEDPVGLTTPTAVFREQDNGQQELVISVFSTRVKDAAGVVEFDEDAVRSLGVTRQVTMHGYTEMETCGDNPCRRYEVRIKDVAGAAGHFRVVMRNESGKVEESTRRAL